MRKWALICSAALALLSVVELFTLGLNFGIDFRGGSLVQFSAGERPDVAGLRSAVGALELGDVVIQELSETPTDPVPTKATIRLEQQPGGGDGQQAAVERVMAAVKAAFPNYTVDKWEIVGPKVSGELIQRGLIAVGLAVLAVLFYIWLRFEWQFSVGAVVALVHDVALTIGIFSLLQLEFNLSIIAAILTIVGYSLNDTVVVFDRVRENLRRFKTTDMEEVLNISINETLSRTLMTSLTTLLALLSLYILGGEVIRGFTFAMIWGVLIGTFSSVFIASPVLLWLGVDRSMGEDDGDKSSAGVQFG
ncbi:MAG: protein translocase subunit SecF [Rhodobacteraceae bacterium]|nr:protein translocase subunit SecF [Paracoccaceae bacterium]